MSLDANAKLGPQVIPNDPHGQSANGELLLGILVRNNLIVCNGTDLCVGLLTRTRKTINREEKSIIDFLIVCEELFSLMIEMKVDEEKKYPIESYSKTTTQVKISQTDHNMVIGKFNLKVHQMKDKSRREIFKYNDIDGQKRFKEFTSQNVLSKCFEEPDIMKASEKWLTELKNILHRSFKRIRVGNKRKFNDPTVENIKLKHKFKNELAELLNNENDDKERIKKKHDLEDKIEHIENEIANATSEKHSALITEHFNELTGEDGEFSILKMLN